MRNRLLKHITESFSNPNPWSQSEIIAAQAGTIKRLSDAYETLHKENNEMKNHYSKAWSYLKRLHEGARKSPLPLYDSLVKEIEEVNK